MLIKNNKSLIYDCLRKENCGDVLWILFGGLLRESSQNQASFVTPLITHQKVILS